MTLKEWLRDKNKTQEEFAEKVDVDRTTISNLVNGRKTPSLDLALRISKATGDDVPTEAWAR